MNEALSLPEKTKPEVFGRYVLYAPIARGGMATVHIARLVGDEGFSRIVAVKRLYPQFTEDQDFLTMFLDEARIASKIHHPNVVPVLDVVVSGKEAILVQEYVHGVPLDHLFKAAREQRVAIPTRVAVAVAAGILAGLHAVHDARDEVGAPLGIVHRDVSPQNVIVSLDGTPRLVDFGIAKSTASEHVTRQGLFKGKLAYMSPEQLRGEAPARTTDLYAIGVLLWELLAGRRLHSGRNEAEVFTAVLEGNAPPLTVALDDVRETLGDERWATLRALEPVVARALVPVVAERHQSAGEMLEALTKALSPATPIAVAEWVRSLGAGFLAGREKLLAANEASWRRDATLPSQRSPPSSGIVSGMHASPLPPVTPVAPVAPEAPGASMSTVPPPSTKRSADEPSPSGSMVPPAPRERHVVRGLIAAVLVLLGIVVGVLLMRPASPPAATTKAGGDAPEATVSVQGAAAAPSSAGAPQGAASGATAGSANTGNASAGSANTGNAVNAGASNAAAAKPAEAPRRPPPFVPPPRPPARSPAAAPHPPAVTPPSAPPAQVDCDPPFYFEGNKKVYKPGCL